MDAAAVPVPERPEAPSVTPDTELVDGFAAASMGSSTLRTANPDTRNPLWEARRRRRPRAVGRDAGGGGTSDGDGGVCWDARQKKISALSRRAPSFYIARGSLRGKTDPLVSLSGGPGGGGRRRVARAASFGGRERAMAGDFGGKLWEGVVSGWPTCQICGGIWVVSGISMRDARPRAPRGRPRGCRLRRCGGQGQKRPRKKSTGCRRNGGAEAACTHESSQLSVLQRASYRTSTRTELEQEVRGGKEEARGS